jgi:hypothetical protein
MRGRLRDPAVNGKDIAGKRAGRVGEVDLPYFGRDVREPSSGVKVEDFDVC